MADQQAPQAQQSTAGASDAGAPESRGTGSQADAFTQWRDNIAVLAEEWSRNHGQSLMLSGERLIKARQWQAARPQEVPGLVHVYIDESSRQANWWWRAGVIGKAAAVVAVLFGLAAVCWYEWRSADAAKVEAEKQRETADAAKVEAQKQRETAVKAERVAKREKEQADEAFKLTSDALEEFLDKVPTLEKLLGDRNLPVVVKAAESLHKFRQDNVPARELLSLNYNARAFRLELEAQQQAGLGQYEEGRKKLERAEEHLQAQLTLDQQLEKEFRGKRTYVHHLRNLLFSTGRLATLQAELGKVAQAQELEKTLTNKALQNKTSELDVVDKLRLQQSQRQAWQSIFRAHTTTVAARAAILLTTTHPLTAVLLCADALGPERLLEQDLLATANAEVKKAEHQIKKAQRERDERELARLGEQLRVDAEPGYGSRRLKAGFDPDPLRLAVVVAGGNIMSNLGGVRAHVSPNPSLRLAYEARELPLTVFVSFKANTTLQVRSPDGTWTADDGSTTGRGPLVHFEKPQSGRYDIYVGTVAPQSAPAPVSVYITEIFSPGRQ